MLDMSVVLVLEAAVMLVLALFMLREMYTVLVLPWKLVLLLQYLPGECCRRVVFLPGAALPAGPATAPSTRPRWFMARRWPPW